MGLITKDQIPNAMKKFPTIKRVFIVGHNCGYYEFVPPKTRFTIEQMREDIVYAGSILEELFPCLEVKMFFAREEDEGFDSLS